MTTLQALPLPSNFEDLCELFLLYIAYSTLGWCGEMLYCSIPKGHICEKRGFLNGFLCPIYGHGALLVLYLLHGGFQNPVLTFIFGAIVTSILEYFTSWIMEKLFHMRWWDYSHYKFQINGRVCLLNSTCFGRAAVPPCPALAVGAHRESRPYHHRAARVLHLRHLSDGHRALHPQRHPAQLSDGQAARAAIGAQGLCRRKREESQERKAERRAEVRERARMLRDGADIFERRLLHSHPDIRKSREDLLATIRARLNESETEAKKAADELFGDERKA